MSPLDTCTIWNRPLSKGYGWLRVDGKFWRAHRWAYTIAHGPIPEGMVIDHLCRNTACVNPLHLEAVTQKENLLRGNTFQARNAAKTHCPKGHPFAGDNLIIRTDGSRRCRECKNAARRKASA